MKVPGLAAQSIRFFDQIGMIPLLRHVPGCCHTGNTAPDHQNRLGDPHGRFRQRLQETGLGHRHSHNIFRFLRGPVRVVFMNPGTLVPDVSHLEQVLVDPCVDQRLLKQRLVGLGRTRRHHHTVQSMLLDDLGHLVLGVLGAAEHVFFHIHDPGKFF